LILDSRGDLFGTTYYGGKSNVGVVFEVSPPPAGQSIWKETVLYAFKGKADGAGPDGGLVADAKGNLYGTMGLGGAHKLGGVFKLTSPAKGHTAWTESVLYSFKGGADGAGPNGSLVFDSSGSLYGTTWQNGLSGQALYLNGTVFKLSPPVSGKGAWTKQIIHAFAASATDGGFPTAGVIFDTAGNLYGTTAYGGSGLACYTSVQGCGTAFKLSPGARGQPWIETILFNFSNNGVSGGQVFTGVSFDAVGNLYGTTLGGGPVGTLGAIYELSPPPVGQTAWLENIQYFYGTNAYYTVIPTGLIFDGQGRAYGMTDVGGVAGCGQYGAGCGSVFELVPGNPPVTLYSFTNTAGDGAYPYGNLVLDRAGNLYGTTEGGNGTVFEIQP
jgi:uncharacterized repeat protein (TIGR03803 family)